MHLEKLGLTKNVETKIVFQFCLSHEQYTWLHSPAGLPASHPYPTLSSTYLICRTQCGALSSEIIRNSRKQQ